MASSGYWTLSAGETRQFLQRIGQRFAAEEIRAIIEDERLLRIIHAAAFSQENLPRLMNGSPLGLTGFWTLTAGEVREFERHIGRYFSAEEVRMLNRDDESLVRRMCVALAAQLYG